MNNYNKYIKYLEKYNNFIGGNKVDTMKDFFNLNFGNNWILTGSEAIKKYLEHFKITGYDFETTDIDIFYVSKSQITSRSFGIFKRKQSQPEDSLTFIGPELSFDITVSKRPLHYYLIDGLRLDNPKTMLEIYEFNLDIRDNPTDTIKISALKEIINKVNPANILKLSIESENRTYELGEREDQERKRLRLSHIDVGTLPEPSSPPSLKRSLPEPSSPPNLKRALPEPASPPNLRRALELDDLS
jgi:hypothetical protein